MLEATLSINIFPDANIQFGPLSRRVLHAEELGMFNL